MIHRYHNFRSFTMTLYRYKILIITKLLVNYARWNNLEGFRQIRHYILS